jgi:hypothetical protein
MYCVNIQKQNRYQISVGYPHPMQRKVQQTGCCKSSRDIHVTQSKVGQASHSEFIFAYLEKYMEFGCGVIM